MNIFKLSHAFLAVIMIASCNKMITTETLEGVSYITVTSQIGSQTKAGYETKNLPSEFVMDIDQNGTDHDYALLNMSRNGSSNTYIANKNDIAWASNDRSNVSVKAMTMPAGVTEINSNGIVNINLLSNQTTLESFNKNDILGAKKADNGGITIKGDHINISFQHLMSKLHVIYETANTSTKVNAITLKNVCLGGDYSYEDINYVSSLEERGNINMYINTSAPDYSIFAAEAIFFPFEGKPTLEVTTNAGTKTCEIVSQNFNFMPGKRYVLKITIDANGNVAKSNISTENDWVKNVPGGKILWIGTSIPAGGGTVFSYPQMVANATGLEVINNAVGGSKVLKNPNRNTLIPVHPKEEWDAYAPGGYSWHLSYGGLVQSFDDINSYSSLLSAVKSQDGSSVDQAWVNKHLSMLKELSYESLIIPYIDGTKDNCSTIVIDHGFNDISQIKSEASGLNGWDTNTETQYADVYFDALLNAKTLDIIGVPTYEHYKAHLEQLLWPNLYCCEDDSFLLAMEKIIVKCREKNPNINIIIGNYFTESNNWVQYFYNYNTEADQKRSFTRTLCYYNKAVAALFNCTGIVNVQDYTGITNDQLWSGTGAYTANGFTADYDASKFCPDGVHPSSDYTGKSNKVIADIYLQELAKIFSSTKTKSSSNSYDYGWEDVEML